MSRFSAILGVVACLSAARAQLELGVPAPPLELETLINAPEDASTSSNALLGHVVVVEFWATWCGPCIAAIPHFNELVDHYKDKPVRFISITDEDEATVAPFLEQRPIHGWVGLDADRSTHEGYAIRAIPRTFLIDKQGRLAAVTTPTAVNTRVIDAMLRGEAPDLLNPNIDEERPQAGAALDAIFEITIRPSTGDVASADLDWSDGSISILGQPLDTVLSLMHAVPQSRIVASSGDLPGDRLDVRVTLPLRVAPVLGPALLDDALGAAFGVTFKLESRSVDVYVLDVASTGLTDELQPRSSADPGGAGTGRRMILSNGVKLQSLARLLEPYVERPVINDTDVDAEYRFTLTWNEDTIESIQHALGNCGLTLTPATRSLPHLVVTPR